MTFRSRLLLTYTLVWMLILGLAVVVASFSLSRGLYAWLEGVLTRDLEGILELYNSDQPGSAPGVNTGGVFVGLYNPDGQIILLPEGSPRLPPELIQTANQTPQIFRGNDLRVAFAQSRQGVVFAVAQDTSYVLSIAAQVRGALLQSLLLLLPAGLLLVVLLSRLSLRPLQQAARAIQDRGPNNLTAVAYTGPSDELGQIVQRVNSLLAALDEAKQRERAFLAEVSHELRTPLTSLTGYLERLSKNPHETEALEGAKRTAAHLTRLVGDLLSLARGEAQRSVNAYIVDLRQVLHQAVAEYPGVQAHLQDGEVLGDPDRLLQLARNLIANAVRAAGSPSAVQVYLQNQADRVCFWVQDQGPGIDPEVLPKLFERFARGPQGGTGLGLAIAKQIAEAHGGRIEVSSVPGNTRFTVCLPPLSEEE